MAMKTPYIAIRYIYEGKVWKASDIQWLFSKRNDRRPPQNLPEKSFITGLRNPGERVKQKDRFRKPGTNG
jgi:hypothetical protein